MKGFVYFRHELLRFAQAPRTFAARTLLFAITLAAASATVPWDGTPPELSGAASRLFEVFFWAEMVLAAFIVPALVASEVPAERQSGTLELLLCCPLTERSILLGKFGSHTARAAALLGIAFPLAFAAVAYGGIPVARAAEACFGIALTAALGIAIALRISVELAVSAHAAMLVLAVQGAMLVGTYVLGSFISGDRGAAIAAFAFLASVGGLTVAAAALLARKNWTGAALAIFVALILLASLLAHRPASSSARGPASEPFALELLCPWATYWKAAVEPLGQPFRRLVASWSGHLLALGIVLQSLVAPQVLARLASRSRDAELAPGRSVAPRSGGRRAKGREEVHRHEDPGGRVIARPGRGPGLLSIPRLPIRGNPVSWRESLRAGEAGTARVGYFAAAVAVICMIPAFSAIGFEGRSLWGGAHDWLGVEVALLCLLVAVNCGAMIAPELERGTLPLLLVTGFSPARIVAGKLRAALRRAWPVATVLALHLLIIAFDLGWVSVLLAWIAVLTASAVAGLATFASFVARSARAAIPLAILVPLGILVLPPVLTASWPEVQTAFESCNPAGLIRTLVRWGEGAGEPPEFLPAASFVSASLAAALLLPAAVVLLLERKARA
ncbi:MAG: hypothetical protein FD180_2452 [Planctomycetota bacterium]|nr:MAG: hypothetical protein FD180_2452 [Planctomycetota bacterium]